MPLTEMITNALYPIKGFKLTVNLVLTSNITNLYFDLKTSHTLGRVVQSWVTITQG